MKELTALQFRQELHDRLFHSDIYTLTKARRLTHLTLHHMKYAAQLHRALTVELHALPKNKIESRIVDGFIICLSMANICNVNVYELIREGERLDNRRATNLLIDSVGRLAKVMEDIDHLGQTKPLKCVTVITSSLIDAYLSIWTNRSMEHNLDTLIDSAYKRLDEVEGFNIHAGRLQAEMYNIIISSIGSDELTPTVNKLYLSHIKSN